MLDYSENEGSPNVAVVMNFFENLIAEAIESVRAQTFANREFVVVDDGSG